MGPAEEHDVGVLRDPALQGLRELLVVEALAELPKQELGREDRGLGMGEPVVQDAEEGRLHGWGQPVVAQVVDEEHRDPGPLGDEGVLAAGEGGLDCLEHEFVGRDVGAGGLQLSAPALEDVEGRPGLAGAARPAQPEPAAFLGGQSCGLGPGVAIGKPHGHGDRPEERRDLGLDRLLELYAALLAGLGGPAAMRAGRLAGPAPTFGRAGDDRLVGHRTFGRCRELNPSTSSAAEDWGFLVGLRGFDEGSRVIVR